MQYRVEDLYSKHAASLGLTLVTGEKGLHRAIKVPEADRPGLSLAGSLKGYAPKRILVFGKAEMEYLRDLGAQERTMRLASILSTHTPLVIVARRYKPTKEMSSLCEKCGIALFRTDMSTMDVLSKLALILSEEFAPSSTCHGTLVEVFGLGVLIQGSSSVGKSETALGLIERGHRLIVDDIHLNFFG